MIKERILLALVLGVAASIAVANPVQFNFTFQESGGPASATGYIVLETGLIANPGASNYEVPSAAVLDLSVTVAGASSGNGTFGLDDFCDVVFDTQGGTLDLTRELVGQPTAGDPWATTVPMRRPSGGSGTSGDFNLISCGGGERGSDRYPATRGMGSGAPDGVWWFTLGADGGSANEMRLVSMAAVAGTLVHHAVPAPGAARSWMSGRRTAGLDRRTGTRGAPHR